MMILKYPTPNINFLKRTETIQNSIKTELSSSQLLEPSFLVIFCYFGLYLWYFVLYVIAITIIFFFRLVIGTYLALSSEPDMSSLMWWKQYSSRFPTIASIAADYYALQVTSIPCEHAFSIANHTINLT
ncbi:zinc finger bed domain-containing protein ricesleeper 2-like [Gigaspora margarita]|uniref:Zinc finger bed domain-containing protein ricesleeper 2-like n=1 Tax=Gigaspora margarita TaxID=4874 RepID=A0A8H3X2M3_GIGMA|nr:zinc finger bed domain-containing protein ricesleeper 2-like [Gigaspora margarita]